MPYDRSYDYAAPSFSAYGGGFGFTCMPPAANTTKSDRTDRMNAYASSRADSINRSINRASEFSSSRQSSFARSDSLSSQKSFSRSDSLRNRPALTRMESLGRSNLTSSTSSAEPPKTGTVTSTSEYSIGPDGRPSGFSSTSYKSPYPGNSFRTHSHF